ncbi:hypothetical protein [Devriesea agamarum]|uniref:hypothetical protein n=1 Tax=Devriesea agamarum TaxID=472569 RepID=UPI00071E5DC8|nr:hypothetical protein [Devriesea agamarum]
MNAAPRIRRLMAVASLGVAVAATSACGYLNPVQTEAVYQQAEGSNATVGTVDVRNMLVLTSDQGKPGALIGAVYNKGQQPTSVTLQGKVDGSVAFTSSVQVAPGQLVKIGGKDGEVVSLTETPAAPGAMMKLVVKANDVEQSLSMPVMDGSLAYFKDLEPSPSPSATPSVAPTIAPTTAPTTAPTP